MGNAVYNDVKTEITAPARQSRSSQFVSGLGWVSENIPAAQTGLFVPASVSRSGLVQPVSSLGDLLKLKKLTLNREKPEQDQDPVGPRLCPLCPSQLRWLHPPLQLQKYCCVGQYF